MNRRKFIQISSVCAAFAVLDALDACDQLADTSHQRQEQRRPVGKGQAGGRSKPCRKRAQSAHQNAGKNRKYSRDDHQDACDLQKCLSFHASSSFVLPVFYSARGGLPRFAQNIWLPFAIPDICHDRVYREGCGLPLGFTVAVPQAQIHCMIMYFGAVF